MTTSTLYCNVCGTGNPQQARFCFACGLPLYVAGPGIATSSPSGRLPLHHLLRERYRILGQVGQGGMGAVYKAEDSYHYKSYHLSEGRFSPVGVML